MPDVPDVFVPILWAGGLATAALAVAGLARLVLRGVSRAMGWIRDVRDTAAMRDELRAFLRDWRGEPARPGVPARAGVMRRLELTEQRLARIERHVGNGSERPLREVVDQLRQRMEEQ